MSLAGAGIIVTGGTGGLGRAVVLALLENGARVAVPFRGTSGWQALQAEAPSGAPLIGFAADMADVAGAQRFVDQAVAELGRLDGLAALAGAYAGSGNLDSAPAEDWDRMLRTNASTVFAVCRAALPALLKQGGSVVTVSSRLAAAGGAGAAAYAVSKAAVQALTRVLALENAGRGVRFNCVVPGTIDTAAGMALRFAADKQLWTPPAAIAEVILFLLGQGSAPVTGAIVPVDLPASARG